MYVEISITIVQFILRNDEPTEIPEPAMKLNSLNILYSERRISCMRDNYMLLFSFNVIQRNGGKKIIKLNELLNLIQHHTKIDIRYAKYKYYIYHRISVFCVLLTRLAAG